MLGDDDCDITLYQFTKSSTNGNAHIYTGGTWHRLKFLSAMKLEMELALSLTLPPFLFRYEIRETSTSMLKIWLFVHLFSSALGKFEIQIEYLVIRLSFIYQRNDFRIMANANRTFFMSMHSKWNTYTRNTFGSIWISLVVGFFCSCLVCVFFLSHSFGAVLHLRFLNRFRQMTCV